MSSAVWMFEEKDSCSVRRTGFTLSHLLPRISTTTVKPRARTSSLTEKQLMTHFQIHAIVKLSSFCHPSLTQTVYENVKLKLLLTGLMRSH